MVFAVPRISWQSPGVRRPQPDFQSLLLLFTAWLRCNGDARVAPGLRRGLAAEAVVERAVRLAVKSNGSGMSSPSQYPLIMSA